MTAAAPLTLQAAIDFYGPSEDFKKSTLRCGSFEATLLLLQSMVDGQQVQDKIIRPIYDLAEPGKIEQYAAAVSEMIQGTELGLKALDNGKAALFIGNTPHFIDVAKKHTAKVSEAKVETVIQGPLLSFSENIQTNVNIVRERYPRPNLRTEAGTLELSDATDIMLVYDADRVSPDTLQKVKDKLKAVDMEIIQAAGQLQNHMKKQRRSLFPTLIITERPDRATVNLSQGKIIVFVSGTPFALVMPSVFYDFFSSMEDMYQSYWIAKFLLFLRYIGLFVSLTFPALYVAITAYNPEVLRFQLTLSVAGSRMGVPYPAFVEILFMLFAMELLIEASIRLPKSIGSTATTVGGLILGQAATEAGLVSNIMIILVAAVAISNFVIPINAMGFAMRVAKYMLLLFAILYGLIGFLLCFIGMVAYLVYQDSCGQPYLRIFTDDDDQIQGGVV
ncbi:spore germination protein [Paenibacillus sp. TRM 82003]|nr:spore germination protein [Paenibacillus sp. TRM 82003]